MVKVKKPGTTDTPAVEKTMEEVQKPRKAAPVTELPKPKKPTFDPEYVTKLAGKVYTDLCEGVGPQGLKVEIAESRGVIYQKIVRSVLHHLKAEGKLINI